MKFIMKLADEKKKLKFHEICRYGQCVSFHMKFHTALWALRAQSADVSAIFFKTPGQREFGGGLHDRNDLHEPHQKTTHP